jgi:predicted acylesterase/phospholipase RssA
MNQYPEFQPAPEAGEFHLGLVLAGAISGGAYTAGVIEFLTDALDAWEAEKAKQGPDPAKWTVPGHRIRIRIVAGASAGAITGAIAAHAWRFKWESAHQLTAPTTDNNPLYDTWVRRADWTKLLNRDDVIEGGVVLSLLNSSALDDIAKAAFVFRGLPGQLHQTVVRPYLASPTKVSVLGDEKHATLRFVFSLANLEGIPYQVTFPNDPKMTLQMVDPTDWISYAVSFSAASAANPTCLMPDDVQLTFGPDGYSSELTRYQQAAIASGAFPGGLRARAVERITAHYAYRYVIVPGGAGTADRIATLKPMPAAARATQRFGYVDGGAVDNEPLVFARWELAGINSNSPREGQAANRAIILIDPFSDSPGKDWGDDSLDPVPFFDGLKRLLGLWKSRARFAPEDLALAADSTTYSRFLIAPSRKGAPQYDQHGIAAELLGGFGGFLSETYRHHDYMLGRRNCRDFLRKHFAVPQTNTAIANMWSAEAKQNAQFTCDITDASGEAVKHLCLIPLVGSLAGGPEDGEILTPMPVWPKGALDPQVIKEPLEERVTAIGDKILDMWQGTEASVLRPALKTALLVERGRIAQAAVDFIRRAMLKLDL